MKGWQDDTGTRYVILSSLHPVTADKQIDINAIE